MWDGSFSESEIIRHIFKMGLDKNVRVAGVVGEVGWRVSFGLIIFVYISEADGSKDDVVSAGAAMFGLLLSFLVFF